MSLIKAHSAMEIKYCVTSQQTTDGFCPIVN